MALVVVSVTLCKLSRVVSFKSSLGFKILKRNASHIVGKFMTCKLSTVVTGVEKYPVLAATNVTCIPLTVSWLEGERKSMT